MRLPAKRYSIPVLLLALALVAAGIWLAWPSIQVSRADRLIAEANEEIAAANEALSSVDLNAISLESLISIASIEQTRDSLDSSLPAIADAKARVQAAAAAVDQAAGLSRLPQGYYDYLDHKREITGLRIEQMETLEELIGELQKLYGDGDIIFSAVEEMDRLWGQVEYNLQMVQSSPAESAAGLNQAATSMRELQGRVDARHKESGFELLATLSESIGENARLADFAKALADAVAAGDQAGAQQAAVALESQLLETTDTSGFVDMWIQYSLKPDVGDFKDLQEEQEDLDAEAAELFSRRD